MILKTSLSRSIYIFYRLLGLNTWKWMTKPKRIGSIEISYVVGLLMEQRDGLLLLGGCVRDLLSPWGKLLHLIMNLKEVFFFSNFPMSLISHMPFLSCPPLIKGKLCLRTLPKYQQFCNYNFKLSIFALLVSKVSTLFTLF